MVVGTQDLLQIMKTSSDEQKRDAAIGLARTGTNEAVDELIRLMEMAKANYDFVTAYESQLIALESLGETANPKALSYLKNIRRVVCRPMDYSTASCVEFPYAPSPLGNYLQFYQLRNGSGLFSPPEGFEPAGIFKQIVNLYNAFRDDLSHSCSRRSLEESVVKNLDAAIQKLEKTIALKQSAV